ncbi:MAG TPA: glutamate--tRNA ligase, partial [Stellaceae bacterium]|nr:glutamate--tRNA ligase [Stellaceae bacterium]
TVAELAENARFYVERRPIPIDDKAKAVLTAEGRRVLRELGEKLAAVPFAAAELEAAVRAAAEATGAKLGLYAQPLRAALAGSTTSPPIFEVMEVLGREETLGRLADALAAEPAATGI